jgi:RNA polymerase sigma-70 factor (ECF subfamily)
MVDDRMSDAAIARRVLNGDKEAFGRLVDRYSNLVFGVALKYTRDRREALDVVQEVFVKAFQSLREAGDYAIFDRWLSRIATNTALNWVRARNNEVTTAFSEIEPDVLEGMADKGRAAAPQTVGDREMVLRAVSELPKTLREVVLKKYMDDCSYERIAADLGVSMATVRTWIARAKKLMRAALMMEASKEATRESAQM